MLIFLSSSFCSWHESVINKCG